MAGKITTDPIKVVSNPLILRMLASAIQQGRSNQRLLDEYVIVGLDPGETTGFAVYRPWETLSLGLSIELRQLETKTIISGMQSIETAWPKTRLPVIVVCEDYKVYGWKADTHKWAGLHTPQLIGAIRYFCHLRGIPIFFQMAQEAKSWSTDEKLKAWGVYEAGLKHARDAERHILNFLFFGGSNSKVKAYLANPNIELPEEDAT